MLKNLYVPASLPPPPPGTPLTNASPLSLPDKPSLVILSFANLSNDPEQEYFSDGLTEDLTTDLSQLSGLFVIARNSALLQHRLGPSNSTARLVSSAKEIR